MVGMEEVSLRLRLLLLQKPTLRLVGGGARRCWTRTKALRARWRRLRGLEGEALAVFAAALALAERRRAVAPRSIGTRSQLLRLLRPRRPCTRTTTWVGSACARRCCRCK